MNVRSEQGTLERITFRESELRRQGYTLAKQPNEQNLRPGEYSKNTFNGSEKSPIGEIKASITWNPKP